MVENKNLKTSDGSSESVTHRTEPSPFHSELSDHLRDTRGLTQIKDKAGHDNVREKKFSTGDTYFKGPDAEGLILKDGTRLVIQPDRTDLKFQPLHERVFVSKKDGESIPMRYNGTTLALPPVEMDTLANGAKAETIDGISRITFADGTKVYVDRQGLVGLSRDGRHVLIRKPVSDGWKDEINKKPPPKGLF